MKKKQLMGILNCTPDSFYSQGRFTDPQAAIEYGLRLFEEGADIVDVGGESTRPGGCHVSEAEEIRRTVPVIKGLRRKTDKAISIDTYKPQVAAAALEAGADWINDISALSHPHMRSLVLSYRVTCCIMHMYGEPQTTYEPQLPRDVVDDVTLFLKQRAEELISLGISPSQIVVDPGIGGGAFGKTEEECLELLKRIGHYAALGFPVLIALSRKSFIQKILKKPPSEILSTTVALNTIALLEGASTLRVHDVKEHRDVLTLMERMASQS